MSSLDKYAKIYVPEWLLKVNEAPVTYVPSLEPKVIDFNQYSRSIHPDALLDNFAKEEKEAELERPRVQDVVMDRLPPMAPEGYSRRFTKLLMVEYHARLQQLESARLFNVLLTPHNTGLTGPDGKAQTGLYTLEARSIREGWPPVDLGDTVHLRRLIHWQFSGDGWMYEAKIWGIRRITGLIIIKCDALPVVPDQMFFNVSFLPQDRTFFASHRALEDAERLRLKQKRKVGSDRLKWLFPERIDIAPSSPKSSGPELNGNGRGLSLHGVTSNGFPAVQTNDKDDRWELPRKIRFIDDELNDEQRQAVQAITFGSVKVPYLIFGPPGTGKTKTIVEAILQILRFRPDAHCLVCGASNPSADTLASRLSRHLSPSELFRMNDPSRPFDEVRPVLLPYCHINMDRFTLPEVGDLLSKRVIVCSTMDANLLVLAGCTNSALQRVESKVISTIHPSSRSNPPSHPIKPHFTHLLVDEAAQATEPDCLIPLTVVMPEPGIGRDDEVHVTLCGDSKQLGPHISSEKAREVDLDNSLLDRLSERKVYKDHPRSRQNLLKSLRAGNDGRANLEVDMDEVLKTPFVNLTKNYRSHMSILMLPSTLFYNDTLECYAPTFVQNTPLLRWPRLRNPSFPILFIGNNTPEQWVDEGASWYNEGEIQTVFSVVLSLVRGRQVGTSRDHGEVKPSEISVISPFREQVWKIRQALRQVGLGEVDVGNVEALQGAENRVVIISTVRSQEMRFLEDDRRRNRGVIYEPRRTNVALTRAKELLVVIGNAEVLKIDPWWKAYLNFIIRNNLYEGPELLGLDPSADSISRLEEAMHNLGLTGRTQVGMDEEDSDDVHGLMLAGAVVRETLRDEL